MKRWMAVIATVVMLGCVLMPSVSFTEDRDTILLARTIYAMAGDEGYEAKLALGTMVMNRVENPWFSGTLGEVLREQHQFAYGTRYDRESLEAAHAVLSGTRTLGESALYCHYMDAAERWESPIKCIGNLGFYAENGNR